MDFRNNKFGEVIFKVRNLVDRNETVRQRVKPLDSDHLNILSIFIDTVSRNNFYRMYKKTTKFLQNYHYSQKKSNRVYEFHRLHSLGGYTLPNLIASVYGLYWGSIYQVLNAKRIESYAKEAGYITGITSDICAVGEIEPNCKDLNNVFSWPGCNVVPRRRIPGSHDVPPGMRFQQHAEDQPSLFRIHQKPIRCEQEVSIQERHS